MAEIEDSKLKILTKHMDETNMGVQTLIDQGIQNDTMNDLFMGSMFEMANDNRLFAKQQSWFDRGRKLDHRTQGVIAVGFSKSDVELNLLRSLLNEKTNEAIKHIIIGNKKQEEIAKNSTESVNLGALAYETLKTLPEHLDLAAKKKFAKDKEDSKEKYVRQTSFEKALARGFGYIGNQFSDMKKSFMSLSDGLLGTLGKSFLITLAIVNLIAYFRPVASMIARFFKTTFGPEDVGFFSYIGQNITMFLTAGLVIARKAIFAALFGAKGFFGLFVQYVRLIGKALATSKFALVGKLFLNIFKRLIAIPLLIFAGIKGFITGFETAMENGDGVLLAIGKGLFAAAKGIFFMLVSLITEPIEFIVGKLVQLLKWVGSFIPTADNIKSMIGGIFGTNSTEKERVADNKAAGKSLNRFLFGDYEAKNVKIADQKLIPNGAGGTTIINNTSVTNASQSTRNDNSYVDISTVDAGGMVTGLG